MTLPLALIAAIPIALAVWLHAGIQFALLCAEAAREDAGDEVADNDRPTDGPLKTSNHGEGV